VSTKWDIINSIIYLHCFVWMIMKNLNITWSILASIFTALSGW
jgi:hypothetical protein